MKKFFLSLAAIAACYSCDAQHQLTVNLDDIKGDTLEIGVIDKQFRNYERHDKVVRQNGVFYYDMDGDKARMCQVMIKDGNKTHRFDVYVVPGEQGVLTGSSKEAFWSGSAFFADLAKIDAKTTEVNNKMSALVAEYNKGLAAGQKADSLQKVIMPKYMELRGENEKAMMDYIKANPKSGVSATLLSQLEEKEAAYNLLDESVKTGVFSLFTDAVKAELDAKKAQAEAMKKLAPGNMAPDFTLNDINGKPLKLSDLRGKHVVLDFWGSWCGWCIKGFPEMKKYYEKYAGKFEILGIDCNDTEAKWKAAVEKNQLPWKHVYCPRDNRDLLTMYAISGFPTKMIIDAEGKIVKTIVGEDPAFYTLLDELFK